MCQCICVRENPPTNRNVAKSAHMSHTQTHMLTLPLYIHMYILVCLSFSIEFFFSLSFFFAQKSVRLGVGFSDPWSRYIFSHFSFAHMPAGMSETHIHMHMHCECVCVICCVYDFKCCCFPFPGASLT